MKRKSQNLFMLFVLVLVLVSSACSAPQTPAPTSTPQPTATIAPSPTNTPKPSPTPFPTSTPNLAATQRTEELNAEVQAYYDKGYVSTTDGQFTELDDYSDDWAQLGWYQWLPIGESASSFVLSSHFEWYSASKTADVSGCGFIFGLQPSKDHYAVFLDRTRVVFLVTDSKTGYAKDMGPTRGTGRVKFQFPAEADFTLIVNDLYAYVLVNGEVVGEYTLSKSKPTQGDLALTILSGTNKDYGTHCEMTNLHLWTPAD